MSYYFPTSSLLYITYQNSAQLSEGMAVQTYTLVTQVAKGVFDALASYTKENMPAILFQAVYIAFPSLIGNWLHNSNVEAVMTWSCLLFLLNGFKQWQGKPKIFPLIQGAATIALIVHPVILSSFPPSLSVYLTIRAIVFIAGLVGNLRACHQGASKIRQAFMTPQLRTSQKTQLVASGLISAGLGIWGLSTTMQNTFHLYQGLKAYWKLDATQQFFALKFQALESLGQKKLQNAVIINGRSSEWAEKENYHHDNLPVPVSYVIYQNYNTRTYQIHSSQELKQVLDKARQELGGKLDLIALLGHANNKSIKLNANYHFTSNPTELEALKHNLVSQGQVLLWGCETAKPDSQSQSLTTRISKYLPKATVMGFDQLLYAAYSFAWFKDKTLHHYATGLDETYRDITATYRGGRQLA